MVIFQRVPPHPKHETNSVFTTTLHQSKNPWNTKHFKPRFLPWNIGGSLSHFLGTCDYRCIIYGYMRVDVSWSVYGFLQNWKWTIGYIILFCFMVKARVSPVGQGASKTSCLFFYEFTAFSHWTDDNFGAIQLVFPDLFKTCWLYPYAMLALPAGND
jgi:hypothetical protein